MKNAETHRIDCLDTLRGLAALSVVLLHVLSVYPSLDIASGSGAIGGAAVFLLSRTPLAIFYAGGEAVLLFFALSGFVLALPFVEGRGPSYPVFVTRRICRIYLPYVAALFIAIAARSMVTIKPVSEITPWLGDLWRSPPDWGSVAGYLAMTGFLPHRTIDFVVWSLIHEMRISLIFPLLIALSGVGHPILRLLLAGLLSSSCAAAADGASGTNAADLASHSLLETGRYLWLFVLGIELARQRRPIAAWVAAQSGATIALILGLSACLYCVRFLVPAIDRLQEWYLRDYLIGFGASGFIMLAIGRARFAQWLRLMPLLMLGRVSYSLYLFHPIVLLTMLYALHDRVSPALWVPAVAPVAIITAWATWHLIERPSVALGRRLTATRAAASIG